VDGDQSPERRRAGALALGFGLGYPTVLTLVYLVAAAGQPRALVQGLYGAGKAVQFGFPLLCLWLGVGAPAAFAALAVFHSVLHSASEEYWRWLVGAGGAFWAWLYHRSGALAGPWLGHLLADAAIFTIGFDLLR